MTCIFKVHTIPNALTISLNLDFRTTILEPKKVNLWWIKKVLLKSHRMIFKANKNFLNLRCLILFLFSMYKNSNRLKWKIKIREWCSHRFHEETYHSFNSSRSVHSSTSARMHTHTLCRRMIFFPSGKSHQFTEIESAKHLVPAVDEHDGTRVHRVERIEDACAGRSRMIRTDFFDRRFRSIPRDLTRPLSRPLSLRDGQTLIADETGTRRGRYACTCATGATSSFWNASRPPPL